jgi:hypothetical protein
LLKPAIFLIIISLPKAKIILMEILPIEPHIFIPVLPIPRSSHNLPGNLRHSLLLLIENHGKGSPTKFVVEEGVADGGLADWAFERGGLALGDGGEFGGEGWRGLELGLLGLGIFGLGLGILGLGLRFLGGVLGRQGG